MIYSVPVTSYHFQSPILYSYHYNTITRVVPRRFQFPVIDESKVRMRNDCRNVYAVL